MSGSGPLGRYCWRASLLAMALVLAAALSAGLVRLLPWLMAPEVPVGVALPFAKALAAVAVETALLVGVPTGFAAGASVLVERGEARALLSLGASPLRLVLGSSGRLFALALAGYLACVAWGADSANPGLFAEHLIQQGRRGCSGLGKPRSVLVPMVGVSWLCFPGRTPRVTGALPGVKDGSVWFTATELHPSADLRSFHLADLRLSTRRCGSFPALALHVRRADVSGLSAWGHPDKLSVPVRALLVGITAALLALLVAWLALQYRIAGRLRATALGGASAVSALSVLHMIDRGGASGAMYVLVPLAGMSAALVLALALALVRRGVARRGARC